MPKTLPDHFEVFGTIANVVHAVEAKVLSLFPDKDLIFIANLKKNILQCASDNKWEKVALIIDRGLARSILNDMAQNPFPHKGNIIVDPTGSTPEFNEIETSKILRSAKERLISVNEQTKDLLVIMYGLDEMDRSSDFHLLQRHMRLCGAMLDLLMEDDPEASDERFKQGLMDTWNKQLHFAKDHLAAAQGNLTDMMIKRGASPRPDDMVLNIRLLYRAILAMSFAGMSDMMASNLKILLHSVRNIPESFTHLGFNMDTFLEEDKSVYVLGHNVPEHEKPKVAPKQPPVKPSPEPTITAVLPHKPLRAGPGLELDPE